VAEVSPDVPKGIDSKTFFHSIPQTVRLAVPLLHTLDEAALGELVALAQEHLRSPNGAMHARMRGAYDKLAERIAMDHSEFDVIFSGTFLILKIAIRQRVALERVGADLRKMNAPEGYVRDVVGALEAHGAALRTAALASRVGYPRCEGVKWRVDVIISTGQLSRVMRPTIILQLFRSNGSVKTFEVSIEQFHQLRYGVAKALQNMQELEKHPMMRIASEADRPKAEQTR